MIRARVSASDTSYSLSLTERRCLYLPAPPAFTALPTRLINKKADSHEIICLKTYNFFYLKIKAAIL
jgi:hypothetical protein